MSMCTPDLPDFTDDELSKLDSRLVEQLAAGGEELIPLTVKLTGSPAPDELAALGLMGMGDLVFGKLSRAQLKALVARPDFVSAALLGESWLR